MEKQKCLLIKVWSLIANLRLIPNLVDSKAEKVVSIWAGKEQVKAAWK
jgi:hypothetical protein